MPSRTTARDIPPPPVLNVTRYDLASSFLMAIVAVLVGSVFLLGAIWYATRVPQPGPPAVPVEIVELPGGSEDGAVDETLRMDSNLEIANDATVAEVSTEKPEVQEVLENAVQTGGDAADQSERQFELDTQPTGKAGRAEGTGRRGLGSGPGLSGFPREQRWFIRYADQQTVEQYGRQLDFFGIELGVISGGKLVYLSKLSQPVPEVRSVTNGAEEKRLYMTWQGGNRRLADIQLFRRAGIDVGTGMIFQFYPKNTENQLAVLELAYKNRKVTDIRRTYFVVLSKDDGYTFSVTAQTYSK